MIHLFLISHIKKAFFCILFFSTTLFAQQHSNTGYHLDHDQKKSTESDMPTVCEHLQTLVKHHEHEQAHDLINETLKENPIQPDCFFYNAKLYFNHKLAARDKNVKHLFDSLLVFYDKWFAVSRNPIEVLNYKGQDVRDYYYKQPDSLRKYCALYKRIYDSNKDNLHPYNLKMMAFCACDLNGKINIDSLWQFTKKQALTHHEHSWKASYRSLKRELIKCPKISCSQLQGYLHPDLVSGREGTEETQQVASLLVQRGCATPKGFTVRPTSSTNDGNSGSSLNPGANSNQPKRPEIVAEPVNIYAGLFKSAKSDYDAKKYKTAIIKYSEATKSAGSPIEKADCYLGIAMAAEGMKDIKTAIQYAKRVHATLPDETEGLRYLSKLYQKGENTCHFENPKEQSAFYILLSNIAWNLSNNEESDAWKEKAELIDLYKTGKAVSGEKVKIGCFIEEVVELP